MIEFFPSLLLGHLIGDYLLQNKWMAMGKSGNTLKCVTHCLTYTTAVLLFTWGSIHSIQWMVLVFLSHFVIDRWSLADKWLDLINGRSLRDFMENGRENIPYQEGTIDHGNYFVLRGGFAALVYAVADNTLHLALMYWGGLRLV